MKKLILLLFVCIVYTFVVQAQNTFISNEYLINKFALSPAMAGLDKASDIFISSRENWRKFDNAPRITTLSANTALGLHHGVGVKIQSTKAGIFNNLSTAFTYAYHVKISEKSALSFGVAVGGRNFYIDLADTDLQQDPYVAGQMVNRSVLDLDFGIDYSCKTFAVGFSIPQLNEGVVSGGYNKSNQKMDILKLKRQYRGYIMNSFGLNKNLQFQPVVVVNKTSSDLMYDVNALLKIKHQLWIGGSYKSNNAIGLIVGMQYKRLILNYSYEFSNQGILAASGGTADISLGFLIGKNNPRLRNPLILKGLQSAPPYTNWQ